MFCSLNKWLLSRSLDKNKSLPASVQRHIHHCSACSDFADFSTSLKLRFDNDKNLIPQGNNHLLAERIKTSLSTISKKPVTTHISKPKTFFIPVFTAAATIFIIALSIFFLTIPWGDRAETGMGSTGINLSTINFQDFISKIDSPYEEEFLELKNTMRSTADFLISCFDIKLENKI